MRELGKERFGDRTMTGHADVRIARKRFAQEPSCLVAISRCATVYQHSAIETVDLGLLQPMGKVFGLLQSEVKVLCGGVPVPRRGSSDTGHGLGETRDPGEADRSSGEELVRQRPDILAAEAQLHSASAEIGVATAALFPSFTLSGTYGANNTALTDLFTSTSGFWSLGANLSAPLFHGGTLWFQRKAAIEGYQQSLANYRQTVLSAFAQVADTLRALEHDAETLQAQAQALEAAGGGAAVDTGQLPGWHRQLSAGSHCGRSVPSGEDRLSPSPGPALSGHGRPFCYPEWWVVEGCRECWPRQLISKRQLWLFLRRTHSLAVLAP